MQSSVGWRTVIAPATGTADLKVRLYVLFGADLVEAGLQARRRKRMQMTDRHCERVGRVVRGRRLGQSQQQLDHLLHLVLFRAAVADDGSLDFRGRVFHHRASAFDGRQHGDAARVPEFQGGTGINRVKQTLDGDAVRCAADDHRRQFAMNAGEALRERVLRQGSDDAAGHEPCDAAVRLHAAVTGALGARIDAENSHAREASISFSSTSKFAQTCWTSSWSSMASISFSICCASLPTSLM